MSTGWWIGIQPHWYASEDLTRSDESTSVPVHWPCSKKKQPAAKRILTGTCTVEQCLEIGLDNDSNIEQLFCWCSRGRAHNLAFTACVETLCCWRNGTIIPDPSDQMKGPIVTAESYGSFWKIQLPRKQNSKWCYKEALMQKWMEAAHSLSIHIDIGGFHHVNMTGNTEYIFLKCYNNHCIKFSICC